MNLICVSVLLCIAAPQAQQRQGSAAQSQTRLPDNFQATVPRIRAPVAAAASSSYQQQQLPVNIQAAVPRFSVPAPAVTTSSRQQQQLPANIQAAVPRFTVHTPAATSSSKTATAAVICSPVTIALPCGVIFSSTGLAPPAPTLC